MLPRFFVSRTEQITVEWYHDRCEPKTSLSLRKDQSHGNFKKRIKSHRKDGRARVKQNAWEI
uniref:Uncharacterized protein n=1 Tax=Anopheles minimus TaxID=112268 RepID=A0A182W9S4_9DIPT